ncbi:MAG: Smr/MutS family protein [Mariprofundaceae bacterium]|nr:Smr/MutS family protein [Mariprofundaceae bacterium]
MSEDDLFNKAMRKVRPLNRRDKVVPEKSKAPVPRKGALHANRATKQMHAPASAPILQASEPWVLQADGVSRERLKRLAAGRPPAGMTLDLHGMTRDEALQAMNQCLGEALACGERVLCLVHGRGLHSRGRPVLKEAVYHWLREGPYAVCVLAVIPKPGTGGGSCLVLLRRRGKMPG